MKRVARWSIPVVALVVSAMAAGHAGAQEGQPRPDPVQEFLTRKTADHQRNAGALQARGRGADLQEVRGLVQAAGVQFRGSSFPVQAAQQAQLRDAYSEDIALYLSAAGFNAGRVRALQARGVDVIKAAADVLVGRASLEQQAALSDVVVVAEVTAVDSAAQLGDGFKLERPAPRGGGAEGRGRGGGDGGAPTALRARGRRHLPPADGGHVP